MNRSYERFSFNHLLNQVEVKKEGTEEGMSEIKHDIERLKIIPAATKVKEYALSQTEALARKELEYSFSRDYLLDKILEKSTGGEAGYVFRSVHVRPHVAERLKELVQERWLERLTALDYKVTIQVENYNNYYHVCKMNVVWNPEEWEYLHARS